MTMLTDPADIERVVYSYHSDPFAVLGMHLVKPGHAAREETDDDTLPTGEAAGPTKLVVRAFHPYASKATVIDAATHQDVAELTRVHGDGFFEGEVPGRSEWFAYRLRLDLPDGPLVVEDPYRFPPVLGDLDTYLLGEGTHLRSYERLGAHPVTHEGVPGTSFAVWAPNAERVSVVGDFNGWDGRIHQMRSRPGIGVWEIFLPGVADGASYKFEIKAQGGTLLPLKADPYAFYAEHPPRTASIVHGIPNHDWQDDEWMATRGGANSHDAPISIYEVHLGSWKRVVEDYHRYLSYRELADDLVPYVKELGFTHIELLPVSEHPFDGSWGYQPIGLYASTSRFGKPEELQYFIDQCHRNGIGVLVDWVPGHFPTDEHGLGLFDGTHLYEHADPRQGFHQDWSTLIYNFGRREVGNFLLGSALYWMDRFHIDGLRVDAVASMLYLDYSRKEGEWVPNQYGGNENLEAIAFLKRMNELVFGSFPGATTAAEESTAWPAVSRPIYTGGLGFGYKWNMGWMHDTLRYMSKEPVHRRWHHNNLTFGLLYAFSENFILPLSHDEVVHGKGSLIGKMSGDDWQKFATLRSYYAFMWSQSGKKLLFMGGEFAQWREWDHNGSLDWHLLEYEPHKGMQTLIRDLNYLYRSIPALHQLDNEPGGFEWVEPNDVENSVISYIRKAKDGSAPVLIVCNFTPVVRRDYRVGVPEHGYWREIVNTDAALYGGSDVGNSGGVRSVDEPSHGRPYSVSLTMPPLATVMLRITDE